MTGFPILSILCVLIISYCAGIIMKNTNYSIPVCFGNQRYYHSMLKTFDIISHQAGLLGIGVTPWNKLGSLLWIKRLSGRLYFSGVWEVEITLTLHPNIFDDDGCSATAKLSVIAGYVEYMSYCDLVISDFGWGAFAQSFTNGFVTDETFAFPCRLSMMNRRLEERLFPHVDLCRLEAPDLIQVRSTPQFREVNAYYYDLVPCRAV